MLAVAGPAQVLAFHGTVDLGTAAQPQAAQESEDVLPPLSHPLDTPLQLDRDDAIDFLLPTPEPAAASAPSLVMHLDDALGFLLPVSDSAAAAPPVLDIVSLAAQQSGPVETLVTAAQPMPFVLPADLSFFTGDWRDDAAFDRAGHKSQSLTRGADRR